MIGNLGGCVPRLLLGCGLFLIPGGVQAGWLGARNDLAGAVIIQGGVLVNNQVRFGKPQVLQPGEIAWDAVLQPGVRVIAVFDPKKPQKPLIQTPVRCLGPDLFFSISADPRQPGTFLLVPTKPPMKPGGRMGR